MLYLQQEKVECECGLRCIWGGFMRLGELVAFVIDFEAHCISELGRDFRDA